jgi:hypothetical protein
LSALSNNTIVCIEFLASIGLEVRQRSGASGFTPGVDIHQGVLFVDPDIATPSNLLHEAGHLATTPGQYRHLMGRDVQDGQRSMLEAIERSEIDPESPLYRAALQCSDPEATAWAWAAGMHLGIAESSIIVDDDYQGDGSSIRLCLVANSYIGIHGLSHAGFCCTRKLLSSVTGKPAFPDLAFWIQPNNLKATGANL